MGYRIFLGAVYRLFTVLFSDATSPAVIATATAQFWRQLRDKGAAYCFANLPAEDTKLAQVLSLSGWRLVETHLTYYHEAATFEQPHYVVRTARPNEAELLGQVTARALNAYDCFHTEPWFTPAQADNFLARYATAVRDYCNEVLVPAEEGLAVDFLLDITDLVEHRQMLQTAISKVMLVSAGAANLSWHIKLLTEAVHRARRQLAYYLVMHTQAADRVVVRNCKTLGFRLGSYNHIFGCSTDPLSTAAEADGRL